MNTYTIIVEDIKWIRPEGVDLPGNGIFEIKSCTNPNENLFRDEVVKCMSKTYGYPVVSIGDIKVHDKVPGLGKQI